MRPSLVLAVVAVAASAAPTVSNGSPTLLAGTWTGRSLCVTDRPACTDETVRYRIALAKPDGAALTVDADKLVEGTFEPMGSFDCAFEPTRQLLRCSAPYGTWLFRWDGDRLVGSLTHKEQGLFRLIQVTRAKP